jgi:ribosomal-protein-alanine N-acetyltransferase
MAEKAKEFVVTGSEIYHGNLPDEGKSIIRNDKMELRIIDRHEDKTNEAYNTSECQELLGAYEDFYPKIGFNLPWVGYFVMREKRIVGSCGFVGQPQDGKVEIAYWTFKEFEGQGIASFACKELISIADQTDPTVRVTAKTAPENNASTKILEKNGFVFKEIVQDHEIGDAWLWLRE